MSLGMQAAPCDGPGSHGDTRPGRAIRSDNFAEVLYLAGNYQGDEFLTKGEISHAISNGLPDLSNNERMFLSITTGNLNRKDITSGNAFCWMGSHALRTRLGSQGKLFGARSLSRIKSSLEAKGYIARHYDKRHRPLEGQAIDLRPLLARMGEIQDVAEGIYQASRDHFQGQRVLDEDDYPEEESAAPLGGDKGVRVGCHQSHPNRLNPTDSFNTVKQSQNELVVTPTIPSVFEDHLNAVPENFSDRENRQAPIATASTSICSPKKVIGFWGGCGQLGKHRHLKALEDLREVLDLSPALQAYIPVSAIDNSDENAIVGGCLAYISENFSSKRNTKQTFQWCLNKFHWKAVVLLVSAIEDNTVTSPERWLGAMVKAANKGVDLSLNIKRIRRQIAARETENIKDGKDAVVGSVDAGIGENARDANACPLTTATRKGEGVVSQCAQKKPDTVVRPEGKPLEGRPLAGVAIEPDPNHDLWLKVKAYVLGEGLMSDPEVRSWLDPVRIISLRRNQVILAVGARFHRDHLEREFMPVLEESILETINRDVEIVVEVHPERKSH